MGTKDSKLQPLFKRLGQLNADKLEKFILETAIHAGASDIHIEPREEFVQIRYRIDGLMRNTSKLPNGALARLLVRIKSQAQLVSDEHDTPQDGTYKTSVNGKPYRLRVSTLPIADGEKLVIRILDQSDPTLALETLGLWGQSLRALNEAVVQPHGLLLVTGPINSGVSTTMYSLLNSLGGASFNVSTIEDPIKHRLPGANQTQISHRAGVTFPAALRAVLRQDPDALMVGEVRDSETAQLTLQAALAGRLVLAGAHTANAASAIGRLEAMGIEPFLTASALRAVVGQRLARRLCQKCRTRYTPNPKETTILRKLFDIKNKTQFAKLASLEKSASNEGVGDAAELAVNNQTIRHLYQANPKGCSACAHTGYKGRIGLFEVLPINNEMQKLIATHADTPTVQMHAVDAGMIPLKTDGLIKAMRGQTTVEEILRLTY